MRKRRMKHTLAVTTAIANLLVIMITLSLAATLVAWAGTTYGTFTGGAAGFFVLRGQALQERFVIENVFSTKSQGYVDIFVRNVGASQVSVVAIYVNGIPMTPTGTGPNGQPTCTFPSGGLPLGTVASSSGVSDCTQTPNVADFTVKLNNGFNSNCPDQPWCSGDVFYIVVASGKGNQAMYDAGAP
jgi:hypothetical protein